MSRHLPFAAASARPCASTTLRSEKLRAFTRGTCWSLTALISTLLLLSVAACGSSTAANSGKVATSDKPSFGNLSIGSQGLSTILPILAAEKHGDLKAAGFSSLKVVNFSDIPTMYAAVAKGQLLVATAVPLPQIKYNLNATSPLLTVAPTMGGTAVWVAGKNSNIPAADGSDGTKTLLALQGKTVAVPALGGHGELITRAAVKQAGGNPDKIKFVAVGDTAAIVGALRSGTVDAAYSGVYELGLMAEESGAGKIVISVLRGEGPLNLLGGLQAGVLASKSALERHSQEINALINAMARGKQWLLDKANRTDVIKFLSADGGIPAKAATRYYDEALTKLLSATIDEPTIRKTQESLVLAGELTREQVEKTEWVWPPAIVKGSNAS